MVVCAPLVYMSLQQSLHCFQPGRDKSGAAIALFTARLHQPLQSLHQTVLKALVFQLDAELEKLVSHDNESWWYIFFHNFNVNTCIISNIVCF